MTRPDAKRIVAMTGGTGFVGEATMERLLEAGWTIRALTRRTQEARGGVTWVSGALDNTASLAELCDGADAVMHIAGVVNAPDKDGFIAGNVAGTENMLAAAKQAGVKRFLHISSLAAREPRLSDYGMSKSRAEKLVGTSMLDWTIVRPPGVYGPGDTEMLDLFRLARRGFVVLPPRGRASFIHVDDLARLLAALLPPHEDATARIFEADDGKPRGWSHKSYGRAIGWAMGRPVTAVSAPKAMLLAAAFADRLFRRSKAKLTPDRARYLSHPDWVIDRNLAPPPALWQPEIETRKGLKDTARWYKANGWL
ncbi:MAG: NAD-dependent epimerase/dehydratase family protein [Sphingorhabdus sp.]